jgi:hypothetical protein
MTPFSPLSQKCQTSSQLCLPKNQPEAEVVPLQNAKNLQIMQLTTNNTSIRNKRNFWTLTMIAFVFAGFLISCSEDENEVDPNARKPFIGNFDVKDQNSEESQYFHHTLYIQESSKGPDKVDLKNFRYINSNLVGTVKGDKLIIKQVFEDSDEKVEITGEGTLSGGKLTYTYRIVLNKQGQPTRTFDNTAEATRIE